MTVREYKPGEHKASFIGLRVVVKVGSEYRQKYFNFRKVETEEEREKMRAEAKQLNSIWNMERTLVQSKKEMECREKRRVSSAYTTGVSGVKMKFITNSKNRSGVKKYYTPSFLVSGSNQGEKFIKTFNIITQGYDMAWYKAITYYAEQKRLANYSHLLERKPPVEQFYVIYKYQRSQGHDIPAHRLPTELDPNMIAA